MYLDTTLLPTMCILNVRASVRCTRPRVSSVMCTENGFMSTDGIGQPTGLVSMPLPRIISLGMFKLGTTMMKFAFLEPGVSMISVPRNDAKRISGKLVFQRNFPVRYSDQDTRYEFAYADWPFVDEPLKLITMTLQATQIVLITKSDTGKVLIFRPGRSLMNAIAQDKRFRIMKYKSKVAIYTDTTQRSHLYITSRGIMGAITTRRNYTSLMISLYSVFNRLIASPNIAQIISSFNVIKDGDPWIPGADKLASS